MLTPNVPTEGFDVSNYQGPMATSDVAWARNMAKEFVIIRLSTEDAPRRALSIQQALTFHASRFPVLGYAWCYWAASPEAAMDQYISLAESAAVKIVALNFEDVPNPNIDCVDWLKRAVAQLTAAGIITMGCTFTDWPHRYGIDLSPLGQLPWWVENKAGHMDLAALEFYPGAVVIGQQWGEGVMTGGRAYDSDVFTFPPEWVSVLQPPEVNEMDEATVRRIAREEINATAVTLAQGDKLTDLLQAMLNRMDAAGRALSLSDPVPGSQP